MDLNLDLLELLQYMVNCDYISDLKIEPYNSKAKKLMCNINLNRYSEEQIKDANYYIFKHD